jgi:hypothetical protein
MKCTAGVGRMLRDQFITACNITPSWSTKIFISTVRKIKKHDVICSGTFASEFPEKPLLEWTKLALKPIQEATESCMVEVIDESSV